MLKVYFQIEEEIPAQHSISRAPYWTVLMDDDHVEAKWDGQGSAEEVLYELRVNQNRTVRLVKHIEEVVG